MWARWRAATAVFLAFVLLAGALSACAPARPAASLIGEWTSPDTAGKVASLSDLTLFADGAFRYAGKSALGGPVAFGGTYETGVEAGTPWIRLVYADFPDQPTVWYYKLSEKRLLVSAVKGNLDNGSALTFTRR